jgi:hypothetical protein
MKATLLFDDKIVLPDGCIEQVRIWLLPKANAERPHRLKYSLFYGRPGERIVGYDNERGKGDHRHYHGVEEPYLFSTLATLLADFQADVAAERRRHE